MLQRNARILNKKLVQYLIPSALMIFAMQFGSLADGILVGNMLSGEALTACSLVMPVLYIIQLPGLALGVGGSIAVGTYLGRREMDKARQVYSVCLVLGMGISLLFALLGLVLAMPLARIFTPPELAGLGQEYILVYMLTDPIISLGIIMPSFMTADNCPRHGSALFIIANVAKVALEVLFLGPLQMGMAGAALSTGMGYLVGLVTVLFYLRSDKRMLRFNRPRAGSGYAVKESLKASSSMALNLILTAVQMSITNIFIARLITDPTQQLIFGIMANLVFAFDLFCGGIVQLTPTVCSVFNGEQDYYSLRTAVRKLFILVLGISAALTLWLWIDPGFYCRLFGFDYDGAEGFRIIRLYLFSFIPYEINKYLQAHYPALGRNLPSWINVLLRSAILVLPLTISLLYTSGLWGYALAQALTETGAVVLTLAFVLLYNQQKGLKKYGVFMIPPYEARDYYDVSISSDLREAAELSQEIVGYAREHHMEERDAQILGLAAEEIADNIITFGFKPGQKNYIDASLKIVEDKMILRLRDDGVVFDPTARERQEAEALKAEDPSFMEGTGGLYLVKNLVSRMSYMRVFNTNNTVMEIDLQEPG
ncbi:MAG: ATP-binding protein [Lachnospiraceae bacterium]|nr:ATP-binding protein [Lachnospiraceae bacterium]